MEIVYSHADFGGETVDFLVGKGVKGIVLAGVGDGNSTDAVIAALERAAKKGVAVVRSSRVGSGVVDRNVEVDDDKLGFIAGMELNAQKARILLMLGLMKTNEPQETAGSFYGILEKQVGQAVYGDCDSRSSATRPGPGCRSRIGRRA